jgi:GntR family transcriptional regulator
MQIHLSPSDGRPIYQQIVEQVRRLLAAGRLEPGDELPTIRGLAEQLLVNPNTVARAYRELELAGLVEKRRTAGTFVSALAATKPRRERLRAISERADGLLAEAAQLGIELDELIDLLRQRAVRLPAFSEESRS